MSGATSWITDTLKELKLRAPQLAPSVASVTLPRARDLAVPPAPKGSGRARTPWGKQFAELTFGAVEDRKAKYDEKHPAGEAKAKRLDDVRRGIEEQITAGTAAAVAVPSAGGRQLAGNFFSAGGHNLRTAADHAPDTTRPVVMFLSGSGGTAEDYGTEIAEFYQESGASTLAVNFGGFGDSTGGSPSEQSLLEDGQAMLKYLRDLGYDEDKIILHGFSMGGAIAGMLAAHNEKNGMKLRGLVLDRPMVSVTHGVQAHGMDGVDSKTEGWRGALKPIGKAVGKGVIKVGSALTRASLGKMSARKALMANSDSTTRVVISGDQGRFEAQGRALREKLRGPEGAERQVGGAASGAEHLDSAAMIAQNSTFMQALVNTPPEGGDPPVMRDEGLSEMEKQSARKLRARVMRRFDEIKELRDDAEQQITDADNAMVERGIAEMTAAEASELRDRMDTALSDINELVKTLPDDFFGQNILDESKDLYNVFRNLMKTLSGTGLAGEADGFGPGIVGAELAHASQMLNFYHNVLRPEERNGTSYPEQQLLQSNTLFSKMGRAGVTFVGDDLARVLEVARAATEARAARARGGPPPPPASTTPPPPPMTRTTSRSGLKRRESRVKLRRSLS
jgi:pimeloyl-ACP methyl ester carboxylesterase